MWDTFPLVFEQVSILFLYIAIGYILRRSKVLPESAGSTLSKLCTYFFAAAYTAQNLAANFRMDVLSEKLQLLGVGTLLIAIVIVVGQLLGRAIGRTDIEKKSLIYAFTFANYGYFGYPILEGTFGAAVMADFLICMLPTNLMCYSYGYILFRKEKRFNPLSMLKMPLVIAMILGVIWGLTGIQLPKVVQSVVSGAADCMTPTAMLLLGFVMGKFPLKYLFSGLRPYLLTAIRMLGIPVVLGSLFWLCGLRNWYLFYALILFCMPFGSNLVVYPESMGFEKEASENARVCFISYVLSLIILPFLISLMTKICF